MNNKEKEKKMKANTSIGIILSFMLLTSQFFINCGNKDLVIQNNKGRIKTVDGESRTKSESKLDFYYSSPKVKMLYGRRSGAPLGYSDSSYRIRHNTEEYDRVYENEFMNAAKNPLSTFSIDVDTASYANVRRFVKSGKLPPKDAVRIEEMINYFSYDYKQPEGRHPFSVTTEVSRCPWKPKHKLVHIGLHGKKMNMDKLPPSNLVFLLDVSGSMFSRNKLPLLKSALKLLVKNLRENDRVAIVVYAGAAGLVLPSTSGRNRGKILDAINRLRAGGSTAGGAGIKLAYSVAKKHFMRNGNNRIILATDGDFNVGVSSSGALVRMIEQKRKLGIYLTVLGFGMGNYKDSRLEKLADKGNGNYAYIDNLLEAKKVLVTEMGGTLFTIAKDVKIQVEFNPAKVKAYRLVGYENRMLKKKDFNNDKKDAGELGAGHTVTALYEIVPVGVKIDSGNVDALKYQTTKVTKNAYKNRELMTVKLRYKKPKENKSILMVSPVNDKLVSLNRTSNNFRFSAAVAQYGMVLRGSKFKGSSNYNSILKLAKKSIGKDKEGYRYEFLRLVKMSQLLGK